MTRPVGEMQERGASRLGVYGRPLLVRCAHLSVVIETLATVAKALAA